MTGQPQGVSPACLSGCASALAAVVTRAPNGHLAAAAAAALGLASLRGALPLPGWPPCSSAETATLEGAAAAAAPVAVAVAVTAGGGEDGMDIVTEAVTAAVFTVAAPSEGGMDVDLPAGEQQPPSGSVDVAEAAGKLLLARVSELVGDKDVKVAIRAAGAAGFLMAGKCGYRVGKV